MGGEAKGLVRRGEESSLAGLEESGVPAGVEGQLMEVKPGLRVAAVDCRPQDDLRIEFETGEAPLVLVKTPPAGQDQVQAIAAATISASAVVRAVNAATAVYRAQVADGGDRLVAAKQEALQSIFPTADSFEARPDRLEEAVAADPTLRRASDLWTARRGAEVVGTAVAASGQGYGGPILAVVGYDPAGNIAGVRLVDFSGETAGVGTLITGPQFLTQFSGKPAHVLTLTKTAPGADQIQALAGATVSCDGAVQAVNNATRLYNRVARP